MASENNRERDMKTFFKKAILFIVLAALIAAGSICGYLYYIGEKPVPQWLGCKLTNCYMEKKNCEIQAN